jgi:hypothetical protein
MQYAIVGTASASLWQMKFVDTVWNRYKRMIVGESIEVCIGSGAKKVEDGS